MKYTNFKWEDLSVEAALSAFETSDESFPEYQAIVSFSPDVKFDVSEQFLKIEEAVTRLLDALPSGLAVAFKRYFVSDIANQTSFINLNQGCTAVSVVQQSPFAGSKVALWLYFAPSQSVSRKGNATVIAHSGLKHIIHTGLYSDAAGSEAQTEAIFGEYSRLLASEGCTLERNCLRTWVFVRDIDLYYAGMAKARREFFAAEGLTKDTHFIASTGIEGKFPSCNSLVSMDAYAIQGISNEQVKHLRAATHLNPTHEYGVTFERGTAIRYADRTHVIISGTASIDNNGQIVHHQDILKQSERMMENINALLAEAGATINDIASLLIYLRDVSDYKLVNERFQSKYPSLPKVILHAPICRPGWLIEAECIAVISNTHSRLSWGG